MASASPPLTRLLAESGFRVLTSYGELSKNLSALEDKPWGNNVLIRSAVTVLTQLGETLDRQDELVVIAQKTSPSGQQTS